MGPASCLPLCSSGLQRIDITAHPLKSSIHFYRPEELGRFGGNAQAVDGQLVIFNLVFLGADGLGFKVTFQSLMSFDIVAKLVLKYNIM